MFIKGEHNELKGSLTRIGTSNKDDKEETEEAYCLRKSHGKERLLPFDVRSTASENEK